MDIETKRPPRSAISFDADFALTMPPRQTLAMLGREWLMHGHLQDRVGMPMVHARHPREVMEQIAIEEWMAASPVYSKRVQRALGFEGDGVDTIFKNIQLDVGAPHHYMDFRCILHDHDHGEFFLAHCGALMDVEPMGVEYVQGMCHTIEDPTFDATAVASNRRAQIRPIHRPPRVPADRHPHCHWTVTIDPSYPEVAPHPFVAAVQESHAARNVIDVPATTDEPGGWDDYSGPFDTDFELEDFSKRALVVALQEIALQSHLLVRGLCLAVAAHDDAATAVDIVSKAVVGLAGVTAQRFVRAFELGEGVAGIASLLQLHPLFWPRTYVGARVELEGERARFSLLDDSPVFQEADDYTWLASLPGESDRAIESIAQAVDPRAQYERVDERPGERCAYELWVDPNAPAATEAPEVSLAKISTGAAFDLVPRRAVRV